MQTDTYTAEIISIGDELLIGQVINSNAAVIGEALSRIGIRVQRVSTVGDDEARMTEALARAWQEHQVVIVTGGLGPTRDDKTREVVTRFFSTRLVRNEDVLRDVEAVFARLGRPLLDVNRDQALVPESCRPIRNPNGTAPGFHFAKEGQHCFVLPGVPYEMIGMLEADILPTLQASIPERRVSRTLLTTGLPESTLAQRITSVEDGLREVSLAYLPSPLGVRLRLSSFAKDEATARMHVDREVEAIRTLIGDHIFGEEKDTMEEVVLALLRERGATLAIAESCTGGLIGDQLTNVPGCSASLLVDVVSYSNASKTDLLGVPADLISSEGAVSEACARAMAEGVRQRSGAHWGLSTTGIAGPDGATPTKPVGLVWIGLADATGSTAWPFLFGNNRRRTKQRAAQMALDLLRRRLLGLPPLPDSRHQGTPS